MGQRRLHRHLYLRIWLAVVAAITVLTLALGWVWRWQVEQERAQRPGREIVVRDANGVVLGQAPLRPRLAPGQPPEFRVTLSDGRTLHIQLPRPGPPRGPQGHPPLGWTQSLGGFVTLLLLVALAVALGAYPVVRRLTQRLETLQRGVERWGDGDLSTRLPVQGQDEIAFLAERFNAAADRVQSLLQSHKALLANASHELRSPLARIRIGWELLAQDGPTREAQRREIARSIAELDELIDEILLASRLDLSDAGPTAALGPMEEVDLLGLAAEECARTGATLDLPPEGLGDPHTLHAQPKLLRRLLRNLLENARRHGVPPGRDPGGVRLALARLDHPGGLGAGWQIAVTDPGPGVPVAWRERIFEPFCRLPGASEREGGVGLGLALVRGIATRHGGQVVCEAAPQGGGRFVVWLPLGPRPGTAG